MAIIKNTNSDYVIRANESGANITLQSETVYISGNLTVSGTQTSINTGTIDLADNKIVLNSDWPLATPPSEDSGIIVNRGTESNVEIMYNEGLNVWQLTNDGNIYANISTTSASGAFLTNVVEDLTPQLGGNLDVNGQTILAASGNVPVEGNIQLNNTLGVPSSVGNTTVLYSSTPGQGTSGLYVVNSDVTNEELITKTRAFGFSLIL